MTGLTVLVVGDYRQTLTIARALNRRGHTVVAGMSRPDSSHIRRSRCVDTLWRHPPLDEGFEEALRIAIELHRPDVIFPVGDQEIQWFASRTSEIGLPLACVDLEVARICQDKPGLLDLGAAVGVESTESMVVSNLDELRTAVVDIGYQCVVKSNDPLQRVLGSKGIICRAQEDLDRQIPDWPETHETLIVQRYLEGPRHNLYFAAERGELIGLTEVEILRTNRLDGTGYAVDGTTRPPNPALLSQTRALVADLKYHGVGCTQFLVAPDGETSFLELNPRLGANFVVADAAGLDLAGLAVDLAFDQQIARPDSINTHLRYAWSLGDLAGLRRMATQEGISGRAALAWVGRTLRSALAARVHVTWSLRDPIPSLTLLWRDIIRPVLREAGRRIGIKPS